jgi:acetyl-CoA carboxylase carboxyltransferase component
MESMRDEIEILRQRREESLAMGGPEKIERQHKRGKLTVRERIEYLFDPGTFQEYGLLASHFQHKPGDKITPADAVVIGFGKIDGRAAGVLAEDFTVMGGSTGVTNLFKRMRAMYIATKEQVPLIYLLDGGGARAQLLGVMAEGMPMTTQFLKMSRLSGIAPQVAVVMGGCAGEPALEASLAEFIIMVRGTGMLAAGGPPVVKASLGMDITKEELGGVDVHCVISGNADNPADDDYHALQMVKQYLSYLPTNAYQHPPQKQPNDDPERRDEELLDIMPANSKAPYDMKCVINCIVDRDSFFEIKPLFAPMMITGFARMNGHPAGIVANQPLVDSGAITAKAAQKQRHFIDVCGAYHVPLIFLADVPGVMTGPDSEREAAMRFGLAVAYSMTWADVPKITVVLRRAFGFGGCAMCGYGAGQTLTLAWPTADFASIPVDSAILAAHGAELAEAVDPQALFQKLTELYNKFSGPYPAAGSFNVDDVIDPRETRPRIIHALELALNRRTAPPSPSMRHGVMP